MFKNTFQVTKLQTNETAVVWTSGSLNGDGSRPFASAERVPVHPLQHREQAAADMGQESEERTHQASDGRGHKERGFGGDGDERVHCVHHVPGGSQSDTGN